MERHSGNDRTQEVQSVNGERKNVEYVTPAVDTYETDTAHVLLAELPGVDREGLEIDVERQHLMIRGHVGRDNGANIQHREFKLRDYYRAFTLADEIDRDRITASLADGVLRLELPKSARAQVRRISVT